jgi:hypothetical protein
LSKPAARPEKSDDQALDRRGSAALYNAAAPLERRRLIMNRLLMAITLCVLFSLPSFAQANEQRRYDINFNVLSYNRLNGSDFGGGTLGFTVHATDHLGIVAEAGVHELLSIGVDQELTTYRFGPQYTRRSGKRLMMFVEGLAGGAHVSNKTTLFTFCRVPLCTPSTTSTTTTSNGFAFGAGGGLDIGIRNWIAFRAVQADYTFVRLGGSNNKGVRVGLGLVFRFGK